MSLVMAPQTIYLCVYYHFYQKMKQWLLLVVD